MEQSDSLLSRACFCVSCSPTCVPIVTIRSYGRLPMNSSRREFGVTDTERMAAVAIEAALRPFSRAHVSLTLLSSDGSCFPCSCAAVISQSPQEQRIPYASPRMQRQLQLCSRCHDTVQTVRSHWHASLPP
jgi:hypothetical protein